jgi:hypothetical protein
MNSFIPRATQGLITFSVALLLIGCGSGNNNADTPPGVALVPGTAVPVAATLDSQAAFDFVASVVAKGEANTEDPLVLGDAVLATSEVADPVTILAA